MQGEVGFGKLAMNLNLRGRPQSRRRRLEPYTIIQAGLTVVLHQVSTTAQVQWDYNAPGATAGRTSRRETCGFWAV